MGWNPRRSKALRRMEKIQFLRAITSGVKSRVPLGMLGLLMLTVCGKVRRVVHSIRVDPPNQDAAIVTRRCHRMSIHPTQGVDGAHVPWMGRTR